MREPADPAVPVATEVTVPIHVHSVAAVAAPAVKEATVVPEETGAVVAEVLPSLWLSWTVPSVSIRFNCNQVPVVPVAMRAMVVQGTGGILMQFSHPK